jgi:hypothetical protein
MAALPSPITLTNIADGASIIASDHRNNYSAIQTAIDSLLGILGAGTAGQLLTSSGAAAVSWTAAVTPYTPAWTASGTPPVLGNGTLTGSYAQVGKLTFAAFTLTPGTTTTYGTGNYTVTLPAAPLAGFFSTGGGIINGAAFPFIVWGTSGALYQTTAATSAVTGTTPVALAAGVSLQASICYLAS